MIVSNHLRVEFSYIDQLISMYLLVYFFMAFENIELFLQVLTYAVELDLILLRGFIEPKKNILNLLVFISFVFTMASTLMLFQ